MKIIKGYRLYKIEDNKGRAGTDPMKFTEHVNLDDLNTELGKMGYCLKISKFLKPYKFYDLNNHCTHSFHKLFENVADKFFVTYAYIVTDATEEAKERLSGKNVRIKCEDLFNECSAALIWHNMEWVSYIEHKETIYAGKKCKLNRDTGEVTEKKIVNPMYDLKDELFGAETLEFIS